MISETLQNPEKVIFNFSSHELNNDEKSQLCKAVKFSISFEHLSYPDLSTFYLSNYYLGNYYLRLLLYEDKEFMKSRLKDSALTSFWSYYYNSKVNLIKNEKLALNNLSKNKNIVIQKSDKGNRAVLLGRHKYLEGLSKLLNNSLNCFNLIVIWN